MARHLIQLQFIQAEQTKQKRRNRQKLDSTRSVATTEKIKLEFIYEIKKNIFVDKRGTRMKCKNSQNVITINYLSSLLPLVRRHEFLIVKCVLQDENQEIKIRQCLEKEISGYTAEQFSHALQFMIEGDMASLKADITIDKFLCTIDYDYPSFHLTMHCYLCSVKSGDIELREHKSARWLRPAELDRLEWLPADEDIISRLNKY